MIHLIEIAGGFVAGFVVAALMFKKNPAVEAKLDQVLAKIGTKS